MEFGVPISLPSMCVKRAIENMDVDAESIKPEDGLNDYFHS